MSIVIDGGVVLTGAGKTPKTGYVVIEGERIASVADGFAPPSLRSSAERVIDASGCVVIPGFMNAHTHLFQTFLRGLRSDLPLQQWANTVIWPNLGKFSEEDFYLAALLGAVENLHSGATSLIENHYVHTFPENTNQVARGLAESGIRAWLARGAVDNISLLPPEGQAAARSSVLETAEQYLHEVERVSEKWHGAEGRLHIALAAQSAWLTSRELCEALAEYGARNKLLFHAHCAETRDSVASVMAAHGVREVDFFGSVGLLRPGTQLVHSVWVQQREIDAIAAGGAAVVHCPVSNAYLASGVAPVRAMRQAGVQVALGTDGPASNNRQDSFESLKMAVNLQRASTLDAASLAEVDALEMAWQGGASAVEMAGEIGILAPSARADVVIVSLKGSHVQPVHRADASLVFNSLPSDVKDVFVGGRQVIADGVCTTVDEQDLLNRCATRARELGVSS